MGAGPDLVSDEARPSKRTRRDPLEDRIGWELLPKHVSTRFSSQEVSQEDCTAAGRNRKRGQDSELERKWTFQKPLIEENIWQEKRARDENKLLLTAASGQEQAGD